MPRYAIVFLLAVVVLPTVHAGDSVRYYRGVASIKDALAHIEGRCRVRGHEAVLVAFEHVDFCEHKRRYRGEPDYEKDLALWYRELQAWKNRTKINIQVCLTGSSKALVVRSGNKALQSMQRDAKRQQVVKPKKWLQKLMRLPKSKKPALVYVTGSPRSSGRYVRSSAGRGSNARARGARTGSNMVSSIGWDDPAVAKALKRARATLYVVAPEARFADFLPVAEVPLGLWVFCAVPTADTRSRRFTTDFIANTRVSMGFPGGVRRLEGRTDCPSGFGFPEYTLNVAGTDGAYIFYPARNSNWLDPCPYEAGLLTKLAPRVASTDMLLAARSKDPVLHAIQKVGQAVDELAAKAGARFGDDRGHGFLMGQPLIAVRERDHSRFDKLASSAQDFAKGLDGVLEQLSQATASLVGDPRAQRRSWAQLRHTEFLLAMRAFHLEAWANAARSVAAFVKAGGNDRKNWKNRAIRIGSRMVFKLSDCLPAYDGAKLKSRRRDWRSMASKFYRAELPPKVVLGALQGLQAARAKRMVEAAQDVMANEAKSGWGWMVYYAEVHSFHPHWTGTWKGPYRGKKPSSSPTKPKTPPEKPGSGGTGPTTGGGV